jgi:hypothetical protein
VLQIPEKPTRRVGFLGLRAVKNGIGIKLYYVIIAVNELEPTIQPYPFSLK